MMTSSLRAVALCLLLVPSLYAATFTVSSSANSGPGTLRQAILDANATPGRDQIVFTVDTVTVTAERGLPEITDVVDIDGSVGSTRVRISGVVADCSYGFRFGIGSSGSSLTRVTVTNFCDAVHIGHRVSNVTVTAGSFEYAFAVIGNDNTIGGTTAGSGNTIFRLRILGQRNVFLRNDMREAHIFPGDNNRIGSIGNGNTADSLDIQSANGTIIEGNTLRANPDGAINISNLWGPAATGATIRANTITGIGKGIVIHTASDGYPHFTGATITANSISVSGLAIDLERNGPSPNDPAPDADTGANNLQNYPVLTSAVLSPSQLIVNGTLTSAPLTTYVVELFGNPATNPDATTFLAAFDVTTDAAGNASFTHAVTAPLPAADEVITSTATNRVTGDTSEVSAPVAVDAPGQLGFAQPTHAVNETDGSVNVVVQRIGGSEGTVTATLTTENGSAVAPSDYQATSGTLTFAPGVTSQTITIPIVNDAIPEAAEAFTVRLTATTGGATIGEATTTVTIAAQAPPEPIPTLSEWALLALALGLATVTFLRTR